MHKAQARFAGVQGASARRRGDGDVAGHGAGLSGGQKQRLAIARAVLKRPKVLIFDEATSALDQQTAERFAETVNKLKGAATILFIAHQVPDGLLVEEKITLSNQKAIH